MSQGQYSTYKKVWSGRDVTCSADHWSRHQHRRHASDKPDKNVKVINIVKKSKYKLERTYLIVGQERKNVAQSPQQLTSTCIAGACGWQRTLKECKYFRESWLLKHVAGRLFHSGVSPAGNARRSLSRD